MIKFEDKIDVIDELLLRNKVKWQLDAISWMDYDDVCQIIRLHIYRKWHMWDQSRPFRPWANTLINHQIKNLVRNNYSNFAKPCLKCPHNMGQDMCWITHNNKQCSACPLYAKWRKRKKYAYDVKLPVSIHENIDPDDETIDMIITEDTSFIDFEKASKILHAKVLEKLTNERQRIIYILLFIDGRTEEYVAEEMGFKADTSKRKKARYKQIKNLKKKFITIAKNILDTEDIL